MRANFGCVRQEPAGITTNVSPWAQAPTVWVASQATSDVWIASRPPSALSSASPLMQFIARASLPHAARGGVPAELMYTTGNRLEAILDGVPAVLDAMTRQISAAHSEVLFATFDWNDNTTPARLIMDSIRQLETNHRKALQEGTAEGPVQLRMVLRCPPLAAFSNYATAELEALLLGLDPRCVQAEMVQHCERFVGALHTKSVVTDATVGLLTGINPQDYNDPPVPWYDMGCMVVGDVALSLRADLLDARGRCSSTVRNDATMPDPVLIVPNPARRHTEGTPMLVTTRLADGNIFHRNYDNPHSCAFLAALGGATQRVCIMTPTLNVSVLRDAIVAAVLRGAQVDLILSHSFDYPWTSRALLQGGSNSNVLRRLNAALCRQGDAAACARLRVRWFSTDGVEPVTGKVPGASHAKGAAFDNQVLILGSSNQDMQSWFNSRETNVVIDDAAATQTWVTSIFDRYFASGVEASPDGYAWLG